MTTEVIDSVERKIIDVGGNKAVTLPATFYRIAGFKDGEDIKVFLCYGKYGYFIAIAPKVQKKKDIESLD